MFIITDRLLLRPWREADLENFVALHADPEVMVDTPALTRSESAAKFQRYRDAFDRLGYCRWAVEHRTGAFLGYIGIMPVPDTYPAAPGVEIGWRLRREAWGKGCATGGARAALRDGFRRMGFAEVKSFTAPENFRSQSVMRRLGLERDAARDFLVKSPQGDSVFWMWIAQAQNWSGETT